MSRPLALICLLFLIFPLAAQAQSDRWKELDSLGREIATATDFGELDIKLKEISKTISKDVGEKDTLYAKALTEIGRSYFYQKDYKNADKHLQKAVLIRKTQADTLDYSYRKLIQTIGATYEIRQLYPQAETYYQKVSTLTQKAEGKQSKAFTETLRTLGNLFLVQQKYQEATAFYTEGLEIQKNLVGEKHIDYAPFHFLLGVAYYELNNYKKAILHYEATLSIYEAHYGEKHQETLNITNRLASAFHKQGNYQQAEEMYKKVIQIQKELTGTQNLYFIHYNVNLAALYQETARYREAEILLLEIKSLADSVIGQENTTYAYICTILSNTYSYLDRYSEAEKLQIQAKNIHENVSGKETGNYLNALYNLANIYIKSYRYKEAELLTVELKNSYEKLLGKKHPSYAMACLLNGQILQSQGRYKKTESLILEAKQIYGEVLGKKHTRYAEACNQLAVFYKKMGLYKQALPQYEQALEVQKDIVGSAHPEYAKVVFNIGLLNSTMGDEIAADQEERDAFYAEAELLFKEVQRIQSEAVGKNTIMYSKACTSLGNVYQKQLRFEEAEKLYKEAADTYIEIAGEKHIDYIITLNAIGSLNLVQRKPEKAIPIFEEVLEIAEALGNIENVYVDILYKNLSMSYWLLGDYAKAYQYSSLLLDRNLTEIQNLLPIFSEHEREGYLATKSPNFNTFQSFMVVYHEQNPQAISELYDLNLFRKGLIFSSTQKMRQQILSSGDSTLIRDFEEWKMLKREYNDALQLSDAQQQEKGIDAKAMAEAINENERNLSRASELFAKNAQVQTYNWKQVQKNLEKNEVAVDILRSVYSSSVNERGELEQDTTYIALFVSRKTKKHPEMIVIENGEELETKLLNYYKKAVEFKIEDENSYNQYWKPIADKLEQMNKKGFDKIYFSPDGVYHQISLSSLRNPETNQYLLEQENIQLIGTSRDLIEYGGDEKDLSQNFENYRAYLLGFPTYNLEEDIETIEGDDRSFSALQRIVGQRGRIALLPGTKTEVENIASYFKAKNIKTQSFIGKEASEENFKSFKSPTILHVATHGFFVPPIDEEDVKDLATAETRTLLENPFMRSGLLLAGSETPNPEGEDGVLNAAEAMNLSLEGTELVVLSACETGLGDVVSGEGVYGLQRAFQQAGAKTVLMSLWKVSDEATQVLMSAFYQNLLAGQPKQKAFKNAQLSLKAQFPEPYYWGAFVMMGR
ncbi:MAG: CHAT domain-containing protein [Bernardetiaceae bacterium]|nr:CHAT domain-containing protein [Bernardetiaceae bacterium]